MLKLHKGKFYKYIDIEGGKKSLKRKTFKFSVPSVTNDPFECYGGLIADDQRDIAIENIIKEDFITVKRIEKLKKFIDENKLINEIRKVVNNRTSDKITLFNKIRDLFSIASFSERNDIHLMWSYYADNHRGICIGYDTRKSSLNKNNWFLKVSYKRSIVPISILNEKDYPNLLQWITTKSYDWEHEKEVRLVSFDSSTKTNINFHKYQPDFLKKITFGINTPLKEINRILKIVDTYYPDQQIEFTKMTIGDKQFTLKEIPYIPPQKSSIVRKSIETYNFVNKSNILYNFYYFRLLISAKISLFLDKVLIFLRRLS